MTNSILTGSLFSSGSAKHTELFLDLATSLGIFTDSIEQKDPLKIIEQALQHINLHSSELQHVLDAHERTQDPLLRLGLSPGQF